MRAKCVLELYIARAVIEQSTFIAEYKDSQSAGWQWSG